MSTMSVVVIPRQNAILGTLPQELNGSVDPAVWAQLVNSLRVSSTYPPLTSPPPLDDIIISFLTSSSSY